MRTNRSSVLPASGSLCASAAREIMAMKLPRQVGDLDVLACRRFLHRTGDAKAGGNYPVVPPRFEKLTEDGRQTVVGSAIEALFPDGAPAARIAFRATQQRFGSADVAPQPAQQNRL